MPSFQNGVYISPVAFIAAHGHVKRLFDPVCRVGLLRFHQVLAENGGEWADVLFVQREDVGPHRLGCACRIDAALHRADGGAPTRAVREIAILDGAVAALPLGGEQCAALHNADQGYLELCVRGVA